MTHFKNDKSHDYTVNYIRNEWLKTPADLRTQFAPTSDDIESFISAAIEERPAVAASGYPVALLAERGYRIYVAQRNGMSVPDEDADSE